MILAGTYYVEKEMTDLYKWMRMAQRGEKRRYPTALQKLVKGPVQVLRNSAMKMQMPK
jgi:hypothetical protein